MRVKEPGELRCSPVPRRQRQANGRRQVPKRGLGLADRLHAYEERAVECPVLNDLMA